MNDLSSVVASLNGKVDRLVDLHREANASRQALKDENQALSLQLVEEQQKVAELTERNKVLSLARSVGEDSKGALELKLKINELVRELDKCIAMLNR
ncbi:MAG: hypothetical protein ACFB10_26215 [Salibacteraceae bacterium]